MKAGAMRYFDYTHESPRLNTLIGKRVKITFRTIPETKKTGVLRKRTNPALEGNSPYFLEPDTPSDNPLHFYKSIVKRVEVLK